MLEYWNDGVAPFGQINAYGGEGSTIMGSGKYRLSENTPTRCGRGDLAPTLTNINRPPIVPNAPQALTVKVGAGVPRPPQSVR